MTWVVGEHQLQPRHRTSRLQAFAVCRKSWTKSGSGAAMLSRRWLRLPPRAIVRRTPSISTEKKNLAGLDRRIRYLQKRLPALNVVQEQPAGDAIYFGATVEVRDDVGVTYSYRIVGPDETNAKASAISLDSPLAKALLGKRVNDEVVVNAGWQIHYTGHSVDQLRATVK